MSKQPDLAVRPRTYDDAPLCIGHTVVAIALAIALGNGAGAAIALLTIVFSVLT